jgi:PAS domain S-box-containing protein
MQRYSQLLSFVLVTSAVILVVGAVSTLTIGSFVEEFRVGRTWAPAAIFMAVAALFAVVGVLLAVRLQESEDRLESIIESTADGIIVTDEAGGIEFVNPAGSAIFGYRPGELVGESIAALLPADYADQEGAGLGELLRLNEVQDVGVAHEAIGLRRNGKTFHMDLSVSDAYVRDRVVFIVVVRDVTERKRVQEALRRARDELETRVEERTADLQNANERLQNEVVVRRRTEKEKERLIAELEDALGNIKTLRGLVPICASCKSIRDDKGYWNQLEDYVRDHSEAEFSHGICPDCAKRLYPEIYSDEAVEARKRASA